jgi:hypothetical protein
MVVARKDFQSFSVFNIRLALVKKNESGEEE